MILIELLLTLLIAGVLFLALIGLASTVNSKIRDMNRDRKANRR